MSEVRESAHPRKLGGGEATHEHHGEQPTAPVNRRNGLLIAVALSVAAWCSVAVLWFLI
jgi:hypothetical protein